MRSCVHLRASISACSCVCIVAVRAAQRRMYVERVSEVRVRQVFVEKLVDFSLLPESKGMKKNFHRIRSLSFLVSLPPRPLPSVFLVLRAARRGGKKEL